MSRGKILVVDDDADITKLISDYLNREGYDVRSVRRGSDALALRSSDNLPDMLILDIMLPDMDGFEVAKQLRQDDHTRGIMLLFLSHRVEEEADVEEAMFVPKPFRLAALRNHIERAFRRKRRDAASGTYR